LLIIARADPLGVCAEPTEPSAGQAVLKAVAAGDERAATILIPGARLDASARLSLDPQIALARGVEAQGESFVWTSSRCSRPAPSTCR
jgi:hypothetical protein